MQSRQPKSQRKAETLYHVDQTWLEQELKKILPFNQVNFTPINAYDFKRKYLMDSVFSKYLDKKSAKDPSLTENALLAFMAGEDSCRTLNGAALLQRGVNPSTLGEARRIISKILGAFSYEKVLLGARHGSGAAFSRPRSFGAAVNKYCVRNPRCYWSKKRNKYIYAPTDLTCTPLAYKYWSAFCEITLLKGTGDEEPVLVRGNKLDFVPKSSKTHRTIAKEPECNMFLQLGVGEYMARRLSLFGNSKYDQTRNQRMAREGSITGRLATIDLARASDSISWRLVCDLLPEDWVQYLDDIRSHYYLLDGKWFHYEKFSTMGNGFTFELETILFYALTLAVCGLTLEQRGLVSVYGDDIICPADKAEDVISLLRRVGFETNTDKTFYRGPFRESCGKHYFNGVDVTPFYVRKPIDSIDRVVWLLNSLRKWSFCEQTLTCEDTYFPLWKSIYKRFPILRKIRGGRNIDSAYAVVTPGRPTGRIQEKVSQIVIDDFGAYLCKLSQGLYTKDDEALAERTGIDPYDLYHYLVHPETNSKTVWHVSQNVVDVERLPSVYEFLTERR